MRRRASSRPLIREPLCAEAAADIAATLKALADPVRLRLFSSIASHAGGEACVCDISAGFDVTQPTISHHLKVLRDAGLLDVRAPRLVGVLPDRPRGTQQLSSLLSVGAHARTPRRRPVRTTPRQPRGRGKTVHPGPVPSGVDRCRDGRRTAAGPTDPRPRTTHWTPSRSTASRCRSRSGY